MVVRVATAKPRQRTNSTVVFGVVSLCGAVAFGAYLIGREYARSAPTTSHRIYVPEFNVVHIPVPTEPVAAGVSVRDIPVRLERFPEHQLPQEVVRDLKPKGDSVTLTALPAGLPILSLNLGEPDQVSNPIAGRIPPGMRAMTVRVDATTAVEGWVRGGSIVDVLLVEKARTTVVAEQVRVISAERSLSPRHEGRNDPIPSTVTLLVSQEQCLAINTAVGLGKIAFALRSASDPQSWQRTQFSAELLSLDRESPRAQSKVSGVVSFGSGASRQHLALVDGAWIPTDKVPSGFFNREGGDGERVSGR